MSSASASFRAPGGVPGVFKAFMNEAYTLMSALLNPGQLIAEVESMAKLQREAAKIEATDPARAAALRRRASRIGLN
jgi:hypothetical protein